MITQLIPTKKKKKKNCSTIVSRFQPLRGLDGLLVQMTETARNKPKYVM